MMPRQIPKLLQHIGNQHMGKRRNRIINIINAANDNKDDDEDTVDPLAMIEHTISVYKEEIKTTTTTQQQQQTYQSYPPYNHRQTVKKYWSKAQILEHIKKCEEDGFKVGARVKTEYGSEGTIISIIDVPDGGMDYWGMGTPSVFKFQRDNSVATNIFYKKEELALI